MEKLKERKKLEFKFKFKTGMEYEIATAYVKADALQIERFTGYRTNEYIKNYNKELESALKDFGGPISQFDAFRTEVRKIKIVNYLVYNPWEDELYKKIEKLDNELRTHFNIMSIEETKKLPSYERAPNVYYDRIWDFENTESKNPTSAAVDAFSKVKERNELDIKFKKKTGMSHMAATNYEIFGGDINKIKMEIDWNGLKVKSIVIEKKEDDAKKKKEAAELVLAREEVADRLSSAIKAVKERDPKEEPIMLALKEIYINIDDLAKKIDKIAK